MLQSAESLLGKLFWNILAESFHVDKRDYIVFLLCLTVYVMLWLVALLFGGFLAWDCVLYCLLDHRSRGPADGAEDKARGQAVPLIPRRYR